MPPGAVSLGKKQKKKDIEDDEKENRQANEDVLNTSDEKSPNKKREKIKLKVFYHCECFLSETSYMTQLVK